MWRDLWLYLKAIAKHWVVLATGGVTSLALSLAVEVFELAIPRWAWGAAAVLGIVVAGFLAWRDEHAKGAPPEIDPETELRRPSFDQAVAGLSAQQEEVLDHMVRVGDGTAIELQQLFRERGQSVTAHDMGLLLTTIAETTGFLEVKSKGNAFGRYSIKPVWSKLLVEWAAPPTDVDTRVADKALRLRRMLAASFEDWPGGPQTTEEVVKWAIKFAKGFPATDRALTDLVELRADASRRVSRAIGSVRDAYYDAANLINPIIPAVINPWIKTPWVAPASEADRFATADASIRTAWEHLRRCLAFLDRPRLVA